MKTFRILSLAILSVAFVMGSCSKYEEGPALSLRTKKARITGEWEVEKYVSSDGTESEPSENDDSTVELEKDGTYKVNSPFGTVEGTWEFSDDKESIKTTFSQGGFSQTFTEKIIRLTNKEFWIEDSDGDQTHMKAVE